MLSRERALLPLLWVQVPRYVPLALLAPGQTDPSVPLSVIQTIAWGDFSCAVLALLAVAVLHRQRKDALSFVWTFSVVSCVDIVIALTVGLGSGVHEHALGVGWYVLTLYVPLVCVSQAMILMKLVNRPATRALTLKQAA
jgi:hypothetical protein